MRSTYSTTVDRSERGATLVEMAVVLPVLVLLVLGTVELGLAFRTYLASSSAAAAGSRMLALMGNDETADCHALGEVGSTLGAGGALDNLVSVEIYEAGLDGSQGATNLYVHTGGDPLDCGNWSGSASAWDPVDRDVTVGPGLRLDIGGVAVTVTHEWITGLPPFSGSFEVAQSNITRLEPEAFQ